MDYYQIGPEELGKGSPIPIRVLENSDEVFQAIAREMFLETEENNRQNRPTVILYTVGPLGQFPIFADLVNQARLSLKNCWLLAMDENLGPGGAWVPPDSPFSYHTVMDRQLFSLLDPALIMPPEQRAFPDPGAPRDLDRLVEKLGGADLAVCGIGLNGHIAFNEPQPQLTPREFARLPSRTLSLSETTRALDGAGTLGGALELAPRQCVTGGMSIILGAKKLRLACFREWHRGVVRRAAYGAVTSAFPASLAQLHPDASLTISRCAAQKPF